MTDSNHLLTHADLAERLNMPLSTVVQLRKSEGWPHYRLGKTVRFTEEQVREILARHLVTPTPEAKPTFPSHRPSRRQQR